MHSEYLPNEFSAADLFVFSRRAKSLLYDDDISFRMSLHSFKQSWCLYVSKYKYERYSAAERLLDEC